MLASLFALAGLCAWACASPEHVRRQKYVKVHSMPSFNTQLNLFNSPSISSVLAQIASLEAFLIPPDSIGAEYVEILKSQSLDFSGLSGLFTLLFYP